MTETAMLHPEMQVGNNTHHINGIDETNRFAGAIPEDIFRNLAFGNSFGGIW